MMGWATLKTAVSHGQMRSAATSVTALDRLPESFGSTAHLVRELEPTAQMWSGLSALAG